MNPSDVIGAAPTVDRKARQNVGGCTFHGNDSVTGGKVELRATAPNLSIQAYPLATSELDALHWSRSAVGARRMIAEYAKYMVILARDGLFEQGAARKHTS